MGNSFHRDDQDWKSETSDYTASQKIKTKRTALQAAQEAELLSGETLEAIKDRYLDDEIDINDEWKNFLDDE